MTSLVEVSDEAFDEVVLRSSFPAVVAFGAPWCRPCHAVEAILERLAARSPGRLSFVRVDVDENPLAAARYGVLSLPTVMVFEGGEPRETIVGARGARHYERALARWLA